MITTLIPAAGASSRMRGRDKLMEEIDGVPILRRVYDMARALGPVVVTLPASDHPRAALIDPAYRLIVPDANTGMSASLRAFAKQHRGGAVMILLPDMPAITAEDIYLILNAHHGAPDKILRGASGTIAGHPTLFPADLIPQFTTLNGDEGARAILKSNASRLMLIPLPEAHATLDLDTPEAWAEWRKAH